MTSNGCGETDRQVAQKDRYFDPIFLSTAPILLFADEAVRVGKVFGEVHRRKI